MDTAVRPSPIDLYRLRRAVAALLDSVGHQGLMDSAGYRRIDIAVQILSGAPLPATSAIRRAINRLLSPDDDPNGSLIALIRVVVGVVAAIIPVIVGLILMGFLLVAEPPAAAGAGLGPDGTPMTPDKTSSPRLRTLRRRGLRIVTVSDGHARVEDLVLGHGEATDRFGADVAALIFDDQRPGALNLTYRTAALRYAGRRADVPGRRRHPSSRRRRRR